VSKPILLSRKIGLGAQRHEVIDMCDNNGKNRQMNHRIGRLASVPASYAIVGMLYAIAACAPRDVNIVDQSDEATARSNWRSPFENGFYDDNAGTTLVLHSDETYTKQQFSLYQNKQRECWGVVDMPVLDMIRPGVKNATFVGAMKPGDGNLRDQACSFEARGTSDNGFDITGKFYSGVVAAKDTKITFAFQPRNNLGFIGTYKLNGGGDGDWTFKALRVDDVDSLGVHFYVVSNRFGFDTGYGDIARWGAGSLGTSSPGTSSSSLMRLRGSIEDAALGQLEIRPVSQNGRKELDVWARPTADGEWLHRTYVLQ
jgi:hypothetical protein